MDNSDQTTSAIPSDNQNPQETSSTGSDVQTTMTTTSPGSATASWKSTLNPDLKNAPFMSKFDDSPEGLGKFAESYGNLEKLLGHEKVPIPKGENDVEGWGRFQKAMGIPDKAQGYGLPDFPMPKEMGEVGIDKNRFSEIVHAHKLTPSQAKGLWKVYNELNVESYNKAVNEQKMKITENINRLKGEWGDAYDSNVELGQMVINRFSDDQDMNDFITSMMIQDPRGIKFLAKLGNEFAENKVGEFSMKRFSLSPEQAREEWQTIVRDPNHPYNDEKAPASKRQAAIDYVNSLIVAAGRGQG